MARSVKKKPRKSPAAVKKQKQTREEKTPQRTRAANNFPDEVIPSNLPYLIAVTSSRMKEDEAWYYFENYVIGIQVQLAKAPEYERITAQMHTAEQLNTWIHNTTGGIMKIQRFYVNMDGHFAVELIPSSTEISNLVLQVIKLNKRLKTST